MFECSRGTKKTPLGTCLDRCSIFECSRGTNSDVFRYSPT